MQSSLKLIVTLSRDRCLLSRRWERRVDPRNRVYYVDHNTRTTTWQRPNENMINNINNYQQWRSNRNNNLDALASRFLYPQGSQQPAENDALGPLPEGWGESAAGATVTRV